MPWYRCRIRGENFPGAIVGKRGLIGFYTTRAVEARSPEEAEMTALAQLKEDPTLKVAPHQRTKEARVFFEAIEELKRRPLRKGGGFTFFNESDPHETETRHTTSAEIAQAFLSGQAIPGVRFLHNAYVRVVAGQYTGESGSLVTVLSLEPEPTFLLEAESNRDIEVLQSEIEE